LLSAGFTEQSANYGASTKKKTNTTQKQTEYIKTKNKTKLI